jgi:hypothetical protein
MTWKDINVFQWQQLYDLQSNVESMSEQEMSIKTIAILTNKTEQQIQDMSEKQFLKIAHKIKFLQKQFDVKHVDYIYANGKRFKCQYDVKRMPAGRYIETKHFAASFTENLHRLAATMVIPQKRNWLGIWVDQPYDPSSHEEYANDMLTAPITDVLGSVVFFLSSVQALDKSFKGLFDLGDDEDEDEQATVGNSVSGFMQRFGWIYQASIVAEHEKIKLEDVYDLMTIQFLNDLSYLKAKAEHDKAQLKKVYGKNN